MEATVRKKIEKNQSLTKIGSQLHLLDY